MVILCLVGLLSPVPSVFENILIGAVDEGLPNDLSSPNVLPVQKENIVRDNLRSIPRVPPSQCIKGQPKVSKKKTSKQAGISIARFPPSCIYFVLPFVERMEVLGIPLKIRS